MRRHMDCTRPHSRTSVSSSISRNVGIESEMTSRRARFTWHIHPIRLSDQVRRTKAGSAPSPTHLCKSTGINAVQRSASHRVELRPYWRATRARFVRMPHIIETEQQRNSRVPHGSHRCIPKRCLVDPIYWAGSSTSSTRRRNGRCS